MTTVVLFALAAGTGAAVRGAVVHIWPGGHRGTLLVNVAGWHSGCWPDGAAPP